MSTAVVEGPMPCPPGDLDQLVGLANRVFRPHGGDMRREYPLLFDPENLENLRVVKLDGRIVSHVGLSIRDASILGFPLRVVSVGAVCTAPEARGRGFATALMQDAVAHSRANGCSLMLISGSRGLYHRMGAVNLTAFLKCRIPANSVPPVAGAIKVSPAEEKDIPLLSQLYQREPVRFHRSAEDWHKLLKAGMLMNHEADTFAAYDSRSLAAYACVQRPTSDSPPRIGEYAGSRAAVRLMIPWIAKHYSAGSVEITLMPRDVEMQVLLQNEGAAFEHQPFGGTVLIIDVPAFFAALRGLVKERVGGPLEISTDENRVTFRLGDEETSWAPPSEITTNVFHGPPNNEKTNSLHEALRLIFPVPLLWYGLNYV